jgi:hypothetical protein
VGCRTRRCDPGGRLPQGRTSSGAGRTTS